MRVSVTVDSADLREQMSRLSSRGLAYATANAINTVAKLIQATEREKLGERFTVRTDKTRKFLERQVAVIKPFASAKQGRPSAEISVGQVPRLLLSVYEAGGEKKPGAGRKLVAVPITGGAARVSFTSPVAEAMYLRRLKFRAHRTVAGKVQLVQATGRKPGGQKTKGRKASVGAGAAAKRLFILKATAKAPRGGVYQRVGPRRDDVRLVYSFLQRPHLRAVLRFVKTADEVAKRWMQQQFRAEIAKEIARANRRTR